MRIYYLAHTRILIWDAHTHMGCLYAYGMMCSQNLQQCWPKFIVGENTCLLKKVSDTHNNRFSYQNARNRIGYPIITVVNQIVLVEGQQ